MSGDVHVAKAKGIDPSIAAAPPASPAPPNESDAAIAAAYEDARLTILRSLERDEIDVTEAGRRLEALDAGGIPEESR
jgi:hypothetical protein